MFVLDEADEMLSRGFKDQIYDIFRKLPADIQVTVVDRGQMSVWWWMNDLHSNCNPSPTKVILLSATLPMDVLEVTKKFMRDAIRILVKREELSLEGIRQFYIDVQKEVWGLMWSPNEYHQQILGFIVIWELGHHHGMIKNEYLKNKNGQNSYAPFLGEEEHMYSRNLDKECNASRCWLLPGLHVIQTGKWSRRQEWKLPTLCDLYETLTITQAVIFVNTRRKVDWLTEKLLSKDFTISAMVPFI